jgi:anaerobic selenocysteine-containing dehydrogenase
MGGNALRRTRGGQNMLLKNLWHKLKMVAVIELKMSTTAMWADIILPAAQQYEKIGFGIPSTHTLNLTFTDKALEPAGEARNEWVIFRDLMSKIEQRAKARGITEYKDARGATRRFDTLYNSFTSNGAFHDDEAHRRMLLDSAFTGSPPRTPASRPCAKGYMRFTSLGINPAPGPGLPSSRFHLRPFRFTSRTSSLCHASPAGRSTTSTTLVHGGRRAAPATGPARIGRQLP